MHAIRTLPAVRVGKAFNTQGAAQTPPLARQRMSHEHGAHQTSPRTCAFSAMLNCSDDVHSGASSGAPGRSSSSPAASSAAMWKSTSCTTLPISTTSLSCSYQTAISGLVAGPDVAMPSGELAHPMKLRRYFRRTRRSCSSSRRWRPGSSGGIGARERRSLAQDPGIGVFLSSTLVRSSLELQSGSRGLRQPCSSCPLQLARHTRAARIEPLP